MPKILNGTACAEQVYQEIRQKMGDMMFLERHYPTPTRYPTPPALAVLLCTDNPASALYVKKKQQACERVGINGVVLRPFEGGIHKWSYPQEHLLHTIRWLNDDPAIHGVLVQLPLPPEIDKHQIFDAINPLKDVDVFSPTNTGLLMQGRPRFLPCTPQAVQQLLHRNGIPLGGKKVTIINRSDIVGKPLSSMLIQDDQLANASVCLCHDHTPPETLKESCLWADVVVVAVGIPKFLTADMVSEGAVVIDVGINRNEEGKLCGDADYEALLPKVSAITPVPGGVGPMTVAMLLKNTVTAYKLLKGKDSLCGTTPS